MLFEEKNLKYADGAGSVRYLDGSSLLRPFSMPVLQKLIMIAFAIIAAVIGGVFAHQAIDQVVGAPARELEATTENVNREVALQLPILTSFIQADDGVIRGALAEVGYQTIDLTSEEVAAAGMGLDIVKLPEGVDPMQAGLAYAQGVTTIGSSDAARLLNGSWRLTVDRSAGMNASVKYADFSSGSLEAAIANAMAAEYLDGTFIGESGVDSSGNTYQSGTCDVNGIIYSWTVSACPLSAVYSVDGFPDDAVYVGIRMQL